MMKATGVSVFSEAEQLLHNITLDIPDGKATVIIGGSGSGKSLLLKTLAYIRPPEQGSVLWQDQKLGKISEEALRRVRRQWGFMFQDSALWANMTVFDNLALPVRFHYPHLSDADVLKRVQHVVDAVGFEDSLMQRPVAFSAGKQKILSFMRAIVNDPQFLFLDEPSTFVDRSAFMPIVRILQRYRREKRTLLMVTHEIDLARNLGDYLCIVRNGSIAAFGPLAELMASNNPEIRREIIESFQQEDDE